MYVCIYGSTILRRHLKPDHPLDIEGDIDIVSIARIKACIVCNVIDSSWKGSSATK